MKELFEGTVNEPRLIAAIAEQYLVGCQKDAAEALLRQGSLMEFRAGQVLIDQRASTSDVFFIIAGKCNILVGQTIVATRGPRDAVGEMVVIDPTAPRSATVRATEPMLVFSVPAGAFEQVAVQYPSVWRAAAKVLAQRLREREKFHRGIRQVPVTFVGSSSESVNIAQIVQSVIEGPTEAVLWTSGVFGPSAVTIEALTSQAEHADFAVIVLGPDDEVISRRKRQNAPRDNVIFELGLFMGALGRERTFMIHEEGLKLKIPTDLLGVTRVTYGSQGTLQAEIAGACAQIVQAIHRLGPL